MVIRMEDSASDGRITCTGAEYCMSLGHPFLATELKATVLVVTLMGRVIDMTKVRYR
jgi:hypothetical protein